MVSTNYAEYDSVKVKLRLEDDSMRDEIRLIMQEINDLINNRLRAKLGEYNVYGSRIELPLTSSTLPPIPVELKAIANDLVVAKIRLQNSEKPMLWDSAVNVLDNYLEKVYGWTRNTPFQPIRTYTISPTSGNVGATVTLSGTNFEPTAKLVIKFNGQDVVTTPTTVITDSKGVFSGVTFVVPSVDEGQKKIKIVDGFGGIEANFQVI